ncbi:MAG: isoaspartyl peptidase/L-asparaginase family protein [Phycisphaerales bacterium]
MRNHGHWMLALVLLLAASFHTGCASPGGESGARAPAGRWAIAIHGGAGTLSKNASPERLAQYETAMSGALHAGAAMLAEGRPSLDVCEAIVRRLEDDPLFNAGRGAVYTEIGTHELDASIMDGRQLACGAVAGVRTVRNPISLARLVMERSGHVLLMSDGAEKFAEAMGVERVPNTHFDTPERREQLERKLRERTQGSDAGFSGPGARRADRDSIRAAKRDAYGTVGCVALDAHGNLAAATSTGGLTAKRFGRVGDTPIIGAGCFADNRSAAVSCTGTGEEFIRHTVARDIAALVEHKGWSLERAAKFVVHERLAPDDGGIIAVSRNGEIAMVFNSEGMYRAAGDSGGKREIGVFEATRPAKR